MKTLACSVSPSRNCGLFSLPWRSEMMTVRSLSTSFGANSAFVIRSASMRSAKSILPAGSVSKYVVKSSQVNPFHTPPSRDTSLSTVARGNVLVPLNSMCSTQWLMPVIPDRSWRDPTLYQHQNVATGALWFSRRITVSPLSSTALSTPFRARTFGLRTDVMRRGAAFLVFMFCPLLRLLEISTWINDLESRLQPDPPEGLIFTQNFCSLDLCDNARSLGEAGENHDRFRE